MKEPEFLAVETVLFLHDRALNQFGGLPGLRDSGLLHSALARPANRLAYSACDVADLHDLAAAYAFGLANNHPFNDANKRTAWSSCVLFLKLNGIDLAAPMAEAVEQVVRLASRQADETGFATWLRSRGA